MEEIDINSTILDTVMLIKNQYKNHLIDLQLHLEPNIGFAIGSKQKFEQVLINLLSNAKHAVDDKKKLSKFAEYQKIIAVRTNSENDRAIIEIFDNGLGIPEKELPKIFDPFYTTKEVDKGTGIGLPISLNIIQEMGGTLDFSSKEMEFTLARISIAQYKKKDFQIRGENG
jgi:signal transduction histidine kinase